MTIQPAEADRFIVLKIDVDTYLGTRKGVPNLVHLLQQYEARATFLFSLGPDHTGRAVKRVFRPGFFSKVAKTNVLAHYGLKTLLYGTLLPGPDIGLRCGEEMRAVARAGFECGIHTWDHVLWQDDVRCRDAAWTALQIQRSAKCFEAVFGHPPVTHGAAGWQMNPHAFNQLDTLRIAYASDGRAALDARGALCNPDTGPYRLQGENGLYQCVQMPTTLPTLDELLGRTVDVCETRQILSTENVARHLLNLTQPLADPQTDPQTEPQTPPRSHVYTLHAELEGQKLAPVLTQLLDGWRSQGYRFATMGDYYHSLDLPSLPVAPIRWGELPGRSGELIII